VRLHILDLNQLITAVVYLLLLAGEFDYILVFLFVGREGRYFLVQSLDFGLEIIDFGEVFVGLVLRLDL
jgi:hypothetical protein